MNLTLDPQPSAARWRDANSKRPSPKSREDVNMLAPSAGSSYFLLPATPASSNGINSNSSQQHHVDQKFASSQATPRYHHPALPTEQTSIFSDNRAFAAALSHGSGIGHIPSSPGSDRHYSASRQPLTPPKRASNFFLPSTTDQTKDQSPSRDFEWSPSASVPSQKTSTTPDLKSLSFSTARSESPLPLSLPSRHANKSSPSLNRTFGHSLNAPIKRSHPINATPYKASSLPNPSQMRAKNARTAVVDKYPTISKADLDAVLSSPDATDEVLLIDLRPHTKFSSLDSLHLQDAVNLCAPTTLLRRAAFGLDRLAETIPDEKEQQKVLSSVQPDTSIRIIIGMDQDSTALYEDSPLASLFSKFEAAGYRGQLYWVSGGYASLASDSNLMARHRHDSAQSRRPSTDSSISSSSNSTRLSLGARQDSSGSSTSISSAGGSSKSVVQVRGLPSAAFDASTTQAFILGQDGRKPSASTKQCANPFFDTIRQNHEALSLESSLAAVSPIPLRPDLETQCFKDQLPGCLVGYVHSGPAERSQRLGREFYEVEAAEQTRLQKSMEWECAPPESKASQEVNPYSITAGLELGHLNRYKNIFPYDHARCKLQRRTKDANDYINASHILFENAPSKKYIASQGPLPDSYEDFWQLVYQERVGVVVMLTALREGGRDKCGKYYEDGQHGQIKVACPEGLSGQDTCEQSAHSRSSSSGGFFSTFDLAPSNGVPSDSTKASTLPIARRTLNLHPSGQQPRAVRHIKFCGWPDFDVPPDADTLLNLIEEVNEANQAMANLNGDGHDPGPVLVHCSAGVGRTGSFMLVDVVLDMLKETVRRRTATPFFSAPSPINTCLEDPHLLRDLVDEMRRQRMSMVANYAQYKFCHEAILIGFLRELNLQSAAANFSQSYS